MFSFLKCWLFPHEYVLQEVWKGYGKTDGGQSYINVWRACLCKNCGKTNPTTQWEFVRRENIYGE